MATASIGLSPCRGTSGSRSCSQRRSRGSWLQPPTVNTAAMAGPARVSLRAAASTESSRASSWASRPRSTRSFSRRGRSRRSSRVVPDGSSHRPRASSLSLRRHLIASATVSRAGSGATSGQRWEAIQRSRSRPPRATPALPITRAVRRAWPLAPRSRPAKRSSWAMGAARPSPPSSATSERSNVPPPPSTTSTRLPGGRPAPIAAAVGSSTKATSATGSSRLTRSSHWR